MTTETDEAKIVPLRVRVTASSEARYRAAMAKLGYTKLSTFVRWALENSTSLVLNAPTPRVSPTQFAPVSPGHAKRAPSRPRAVTPPPPPVAAPPPVPAPEDVAPITVDALFQQPRVASIEEVFGVPLTETVADTEVPQEAPIVVDDSWM